MERIDLAVGSIIHDLTIILRSSIVIISSLRWDDIAVSNCLWFIQNSFSFFAHILKILSFVNGWLTLVQPELEEKDGVEKDRSDREDELDQVECTSCEERLLQEDWFDSRLQEGKWATHEVKDDIFKRPAITTLSTPIKVDLWEVFDESNGCFGVAHNQKSVSSVG